jgi:hypothetical protein
MFYEMSKSKVEQYHNWLSAIACALQLPVEYNFPVERYRANAIGLQLLVRRKSQNPRANAIGVQLPVAYRLSACHCGGMRSEMPRPCDDVT